jgi:AcrR family transcriptional regulator
LEASPTSTAAGSRQAERSEATRARLLRAARDLFAKRGYADVGTEEIVRRARVTRGALYHHFADKQDLFRAVHEQLERELTERIAAQLAAGAGDGVQGDPIELLVQATRTFLDACIDPATSRITLLEAPSVLGWREWREIDERYGLGLTIVALEGAMEAGSLRRQPVRPLAQLLVAALGEAGIAIAQSDDPGATREEMETALLSLLEGLRV